MQLSCNRLRFRSNESKLNIYVEADKVELDEDLNLDYLNSETMDYGQIVEESRLRYVAITRAKKVLLGAHWLN